MRGQEAEPGWQDGVEVSLEFLSKVQDYGAVWGIAETGMKSTEPPRPLTRPVLYSSHPRR